MMWAILAAVMGLGAIGYVARGALGFGTSSDVAVRQSIRTRVAAQRDANAQGPPGGYSILSLKPISTGRRPAS